MITQEHPILPPENLEIVAGFGLSAAAAGYVFRPSTLEGIRDVFDMARATGCSVALRGSGRSYGDASINAENIVLDITRLCRILEWNPATGIIRIEAGVTIQQLWEYILPDGWWPPVVPGTMAPTMAGCAAMNVHGKNNFKAGTVGDHILDFDLLTPSGEILRCSRDENAEIFHAAIGGFGMLGCFVNFTMQMKRIYSGMLHVEAINTATLADMFRVFRERLDDSDYLVGWIDTFATGKSLGRGVIHQANYLKAGEDPSPAQSLRLDNQRLPDTIFGLLPKSVLWRFMKPFMNGVGGRLVNFAKWWSSRFIDGDSHRFTQSHAAFAFLLDYVPNWRRSYGEGGFIQYQSFIPSATAEEAFAAQLRLAQKEGLVPLLAVFKKHRPDPFLLTHALDGYSMALDIRLTRRNRERVWKMAEKLNAIVLDAGGRFYFAKDSTLTPQDVQRYLGPEAVARFRHLKNLCDPGNVLQSDLYRRLFPLSMNNGHS